MFMRIFAVLFGLALSVAPASAGQDQEAKDQAPGAQSPSKAGAPKANETQTEKAERLKKEADELPHLEEMIVVTASKVEQQLIDAPATMSVVNAQTLALKPSGDYANLFRSIPGVNVSQTSARDINITSRGATGTLSTSQLALIDGRSLYLDFFGFIGWDFLPVNFNEIKQVEVIRGPASAIWGANAMNGVVNIITKPPRDVSGTTFSIGVGGFNRTVEGQTSDLGTGTSFYSNISHAQAINDRWSYKLSAGYFTQNAFARPVGTIDNPYHTPYPNFHNTGSDQPKFDGRIDFDFPDGKQVLSFTGGYAGTSGIIHTGIGPFQIERGTNLSYAKADYIRGGFRVKFFSNLLDGKAPALMAYGADGKPIRFLFETQTYDFEVSNISTLGKHHIFSYGGNVRHNGFALSIAPGGDTRNEQGFYAQDEISLGKYFRWQIGGRFDHFDVLADPVFSPRTTLLFKPMKGHTFRISYNQAFRAPSLVNNFLDVTILNQLDLGLINPALSGKIYTFPILAQGNTHLTKQYLRAYEAGYSGIIKNRFSLNFAWYYNDMRDEIFFTQDGSYTSKNPPPGWPLPPVVLDLLILKGAFGPGNGLPSHFTYLNLGKVKYIGFETGIDMAVTRSINAFINYSYQPEPSPNFPKSEINIPPRNRLNAGFSATKGRYMGDFMVTTQSAAYWQDVLDARYAGTTDAFTLVNASFGIRWAEGKVTTSIKATNILNQEVKQHVFGDVIKAAVFGELKFRIH